MRVVTFQSRDMTEQLLKEGFIQTVWPGGRWV